MKCPKEMVQDHRAEAEVEETEVVEEEEELQEEDQVQEQAGKKETVNRKADPPQGFVGVLNFASWQ